MFRKLIHQIQPAILGKIRYQRVRGCLLLSLFLYSCSNEKRQTAEQIIQTSLNAVGKKDDREKVQNLVSLADCISPNGKYTTEIHTSQGDYSYFKQVYSYKTAAFEALIENKASGYVLGDSLIPLSKEALNTIRRHEFHNLILEVDHRFHDFGKPENIEMDGMKTYRLNTKDELNNECSLFFEIKTGLLSALHFQNPSDAKEIIKTKFSDWKNVKDILLPHHVDIDQSGKKYMFHFTKVIINSPDFRYKNVKK